MTETTAHCAPCGDATDRDLATLFGARSSGSIPSRTDHSDRAISVDDQLNVLAVANEVDDFAPTAFVGRHVEHRQNAIGLLGIGEKVPDISVDHFSAQNITSSNGDGEIDSLGHDLVPDPRISARYDRPLNMIAIGLDGEDDVYLPRDGAFSFLDEIAQALEVQAKLGGTA